MHECGEWGRNYKVPSSPRCRPEFCYIRWVWGMWDVHGLIIFTYNNTSEEGLGLWGPALVGARTPRYPPFRRLSEHLIAPGPKALF